MTGAWMLVACLLGGIWLRDQGKVQAKNRVDCNTEEEDYFSGSDTTSQYTMTGLLNREVLLAIAEAETTEP